MERKIGEIFEFGGEWYQCVESNSCGECSLFTTECGSGTKSDLADKVVGQCSKVRRTDNKHVTFKKLEKVGEPYEFDGHLFQSYRTFEVPIFTENYATVRELGNNSKISIEIKQNKEDMSNTETLWYGPDKKGAKSLKLSNLKPFSLEAAKAGNPVCTRDGRKARIICFDAKGEKPIIALIANGNSEDVNYYYITGKVRFLDKEDENDLMMLPEKKEGWILLRKDGCVFDNEEVAKKNCTDDYFVAKVEWEE